MASTAKSTRDDVARRASEIAKDFEDMGHTARQMAAERAEQMRETANQYLDQGKVRARELGATMQHQIQEQPVRSMLIAGAIGFILGALWIRR
jgi:ElaB/YqjD/DUF883 family membrane-anchored ribosome-binding protein